MSIQKIQQQLKEFQQHLDQIDLVNEKVSKASVGWHVSHSTQIFSAICKNTADSDPSEYKYSFNKNRFKIKLIGYIPRGLGRSPKAFLNQENLEVEQMRTYLLKAEDYFKTFCEVENNAFFVHPIFGQLNKKWTFWFLQLHNEHHLKIIRDIKKN